MTPRSYAFASLLAVTLLAFGSVADRAVAQETPLKIAVVNMDQVISQSASGIAMNEKLQAHQADAQQQSQERVAKIDALRTEISEGVGKLDQAQLISLQSQFEAAQTDLREFRDAKQKEAQQIQADGLGEIQAQIDPVFKAIQEEFDYDLILNQQSGVVLMVGDRVNITQMVIDRSQ